MIIVCLHWFEEGGDVTYAGGFCIKRIGFWLDYPRGNLTIAIVGDAIDAISWIHSDLLGSVELESPSYILCFYFNLSGCNSTGSCL